MSFDKINNFRLKQTLIYFITYLFLTLEKVMSKPEFEDHVEISSESDPEDIDLDEIAEIHVD